MTKKKWPNKYIILEIRDSQNLAKIGLGGQMIQSDVVFCLAQSACV